MRAMLPYFSKKWELRGTVEGSDLGNGSFQFRFDYADDLRKVLENRPYQVILEKWEPIISSSFPSQIPFWISLRGLPLHYWKRELLLSIGDKIGHLTSYELTSTAAKIKVEVNGLEAIIKEAIVEFDGGSEALVTLDYHRLDKHCLYCFKLTHEEFDCPENPKANRSPLPERTYSSQRPNHLKPPFLTYSGENQISLHRNASPNRRGTYSAQRPHRSHTPPRPMPLRAAHRSPNPRNSLMIGFVCGCEKI
ncbi:unnamed protein product [Microthlaspi erraticum]|uniref:DUF4283 domain-containing protein n=1 Tax=Microthlaspi erraticum TaxID=1685480 RepID=A0A6D2II81_9BRAS|nr:unnamed protein product [Microthlaspi erraticum]